MELKEVKDKIDKYFDNITPQEFSDVLTKEYNMPFVPAIVWVNDNKENAEIYKGESVYNSNYYGDVHTLRSEYSGQSYVYFPFKYDNDSLKFELVDVSECGNINKEIPDFIDGYFIMYKRDIRTKNPKYRYIKTSEIKKIMLSEVNEYVQYLNEGVF